MIFCGIEQGDQDICPSLTLVVKCSAIRYVGGIPVFTDVRSREDLTIDPDDIGKEVTARNKALVVMHSGGFTYGMYWIMAIAQKHSLKVIEDACHSSLSEYQVKKFGTIGDVRCFSFFSNKNISTGEGGMLVTNHKAYFERAKPYSSHGMTSLSYERSKGHSSS